MKGVAISAYFSDWSQCGEQSPFPVTVLRRHWRQLEEPSVFSSTVLGSVVTAKGSVSINMQSFGVYRLQPLWALNINSRMGVYIQEDPHFIHCIKTISPDSAIYILSVPFEVSGPSPFRAQESLGKCRLGFSRSWEGLRFCICTYPQSYTHVHIWWRQPYFCTGVSCPRKWFLPSHPWVLLIAWFMLLFWRGSHPLLYSEAGSSLSNT